MRIRSANQPERRLFLRERDHEPEPATDAGPLDSANPGYPGPAREQAPPADRLSAERRGLLRRRLVRPGETPSGSEGVRAGTAGGPPRRRRSMMWRTRDAGAAAVGAAGAGVLLLARFVMALAALIALLIAVAIVLRDVDANPSNAIVKGLHQGANFFAGSFTGLISFSGHPKRAITVDWGIALIVYLLAGAFLAGVIARVGRGGVLFERSHRAVPSH